MCTDRSRPHHPGGRRLSEAEAMLFRMRGGPFGPSAGAEGPFGPGFGGGFGPRGGRGGPGWGRHSARRRRGDVRAALLLLLAEEPRNGYQLMQTLEQRSDGRWRPSPGSVYPALAQLEDEGLVRSRTREGESGRLFEITDAGREQLSERGERTAPWEPRDGESHEGYAGYRRAIAAAAAAAWQVAQTGDEAQLARGVEILDEARRQLYRLLAGEAG